MTSARIAFVDTYVLRQGRNGFEVLVLRRAPHGRCPGAWETVHGTIEAGETPVEAAVRELAEETGLKPGRLYNASRVEAFYRHGADEVALIPAFVAIVDASVSAARGSVEHDVVEWLRPAEAAQRLSWPRERRALEDVLSILRSGDAGLLEDVLRIC